MIGERTPQDPVEPRHNQTRISKLFHPTCYPDEALMQDVFCVRARLYPAPNERDELRPARDVRSDGLRPFGVRGPVLLDESGGHLLRARSVTGFQRR